MTEEAPAPPDAQAGKKRVVPWCLLAGVLFYIVFLIVYRQIDSELYRNRDDGIITVSHARNLVEYGSIGVNPSGERVEGYSSPLQLLLFSGAYKTTGIEYDLYFRLVASLSVFVCGLLMFILCLPHRAWGCLLTPFAALILTQDFSFLEWHASGMENPLIHLFFLLSVVLLVRMYSRSRLSPFAVLMLVAASLARIESIYHIAPLLLIFLLAWSFTYRNLWGVALVTAVFLLWGGVFVARWRYFGSLFPNTAAAQGISMSDRLGLFLTFDPGYYSRSLETVGRIFRWHHGLALAPIIACLPFLKINGRSLLTIALLLSLALTGILSPFLFGAARLDPTRLSTHVALALIALAVYMAVQTRRPRFRWISVPLVIGALSGMVYWQQVEWKHKPYYLWFSENVFAEYRDTLLELAQEHEIPRPTVANPDLGLMSWHKTFNIVDLGYLGSPVLTQLDKLPELSKEATADYFFDMAAPDLIECHGIWSERHAHLFKDPRFHEIYAASESEIDPFLRKRFQRNATFRLEFGDYVRAGYWVRRDMMKDSGSLERALVDDLAAGATVARLEAELKRCEANSLSAAEAYYVVRTAYRFLPEFVQQGDYDALLTLFERYQESLGYSTAMLRGRATPDWADALTAYVVEHVPERAATRMSEAYESEIATADGQTVTLQRPITENLRLDAVRLAPAGNGWGKLQLVFACTAPLERDWKVYVHAQVPADKRPAMPAEQRGLGFLNWDFGVTNPPARHWHEYPYVVLTQYVRHGDLAESLTVGLHLQGVGAHGTGVELQLPNPTEIPAPPPSTGDVPAD